MRTRHGVLFAYNEAPPRLDRGIRFRAAAGTAAERWHDQPFDRIPITGLGQGREEPRGGAARAHAACAAALPHGVACDLLRRLRTMCRRARCVVLRVDLPQTQVRPDAANRRVAACGGKYNVAADRQALEEQSRLSPALPSLALATPASSAAAQESEQAFFAGKTVRFVVGFGPGGGYDAYARMLAPYLSKTLGATVIVENRPGAGGLLALNGLYIAPPDFRPLDDDRERHRRGLIRN